MDDGVHQRPFAGQTVLVTGGARRLGRVLCRRLAMVGCNVAIHYNGSKADAESLAEQIRALGVRAATVQADLSDAEEAEGLVAKARKAMGRAPTMLVNNASSFDRATLATLTRDELESAVAVDAWAPLAILRSFAAGASPVGMGAGEAVACVNLLDTRITAADWDHMGYQLAKGMLRDLTRITAVHYAPRVRVNAVAPGFVLPPEDVPKAAREEMTAAARRATPLDRTPTPDDVADAVLYLLGAASVTGEVLFVDGGRHLVRSMA